MSITWTWLINLVAPLLSQMIKMVSPAIIAELNEFATDLYLKSIKTPNPWDDMFTGVLLDILAIPRPTPP